MGVHCRYRSGRRRAVQSSLDNPTSGETDEIPGAGPVDPPHHERYGTQVSGDHGIFDDHDNPRPI